MSCLELKEKGNECIRLKKYEEAASYYTTALSADPSSHAVYSNRSLAFSNLKRFDRALEDADQCITLAPNFARGYLRKSVALTGLGEYDRAMTAAELGYKLRASDKISSDCVAQWLEATDHLIGDKVDKIVNEIGLPKNVIPKGCKIISDDYLTIFLNVLLCRLQFTSTGVEIGFISSCVNKLLEELGRILQLFGHTATKSADKWLLALALASKVDPSTLRVPQVAATTLLERSIEFSNWLDTEVDSALYCIISPIISLMMIAINARCISLNLLNSDQSVVQTISKACLVFFERPILSHPDYLLQHISVYKELLEAFGTSNYSFTKAEEAFGRECIKKLESLLKQCPNDEYSKDPCDKAMVSIALAQIRLGDSPQVDPVDYAPESGKAISRIGISDPEQLKTYVQDKVEALKHDLDSVMMEFSYRDIQDLLSCIGKICMLHVHNSVCIYVAVLP